jgi:hypothetical protein
MIKPTLTLVTLLFSACTLLRGVHTLEATLIASPALTNSEATLSLMLSTKVEVPGLTGGLRLISPTDFSSYFSCQVIEPASLTITDCTQTSDDTTAIDIKLGDNWTGSLYL